MSGQHAQQTVAPERIDEFNGSYDDDQQSSLALAQADKPKIKRPRKPKTPGLNRAVLIFSDDDYRSLNEITTFRKSRLLYPNGEPIESPNEGCTPFGVVLAQICREWFDAVNFQKSVQG